MGKNINNQKSKITNNNSIYVPLFNKEIKVECGDEVKLEYKELCLNHLLNMKDSMIDELCNKMIEYYKLYNDYEIPNMPKEVSGRDILKYIDIINIYIDEPEANIPAIHLDGNCTWEEEHGIEISILGDKIIYVGGYTGYSPWENYNSPSINNKKINKNKIIKDNTNHGNNKTTYLILFIYIIPVFLMIVTITIFEFMSSNISIEMPIFTIFFALLEIYLFKKYKKTEK